MRYNCKSVCWLQIVVEKLRRRPEGSTMMFYPITVLLRSDWFDLNFESTVRTAARPSRDGSELKDYGIQLTED